MAREIIVTIDTQGNAVIETKGFTGSECLKETAALESALGAKTSDRKTREYGQQATTAATARTRS